MKVNRRQEEGTARSDQEEYQKNRVSTLVNLCKDIKGALDIFEKEGGLTWEGKNYIRNLTTKLKEVE
tara:strand:- start:589 stop:789 length:201 start_codon:yes stop_codon:yes gene_type:complete